MPGPIAPVIPACSHERGGGRGQIHRGPRCDAGRSRKDAVPTVSPAELNKATKQFVSPRWPRAKRCKPGADLGANWIAVNDLTFPNAFSTRQAGEAADFNGSPANISPGKQDALRVASAGAGPKPVTASVSPPKIPFKNLSCPTACVCSSRKTSTAIHRVSRVFKAASWRRLPRPMA